MPMKLLFGLDDSEFTYQALRNVGSLLAPAGIGVHLFHAAPESTLCHPGELSTVSGEPAPLQKALEGQAQAILKQAVDLLLKLGFERPRIESELRLNSVNAAQEILAAAERAAPAAIAVARKGRSAITRFFLGSTATLVCHYAETLPVWVVGTRRLRPPHLLAALDESACAERVIAQAAAFFGKIPGTRVTLFHVIPAKPPGFWDDGHILDNRERLERERRVADWHTAHAARTEDVFLRLAARLSGAGVAEGAIEIKRQAMAAGIARDILAEAAGGDYNILAIGRRGDSAIKEFSLGSRAAKILNSPLENTLLLVN
jgi:nucleotide-binding universal stress UspA family protein